MTIQTWKNVPFDISEHPYCKHFWKCTEVVGDTVLVDAVGGANIEVGAITNPATGAISNSTPGVKSLAASLATLDGTDFIIAYFGVIAATTGMFSVGNIASGHGIAFPGAGSVTYDRSVKGGTGTVTFGDTTSTTAVGHYCVSDTDGNSNFFDDGTGDTPAATSGAGTITPDNVLVMSGTSAFKGIAVFSWADGNLPANYETVMKWLFNEWNNNRKVLPPMWRGLS